MLLHKEPEVTCMQLKEYLFYNRMTLSEFSKKIGVSKSTVSRLINGVGNTIPIYLMKKVVEATEGKVSYEDIIKEMDRIFPEY